MHVVVNKIRLSDDTLHLNTEQRSEEDRAVRNLKVSN